jgi:hypothetical protein
MKYINNPATKCTCDNPQHHALWILNKKGIISSFQKILKSNDINNLSKDAYQFIMGLSGFIAHYDINGFMSNYQDLRTFIVDILNSSDITDADRYITDNYFSENEQKQYYADKAELCKELCRIAKEYQTKIEKSFLEIEKAELKAEIIAKQNYLASL